MKFKAGDRVVFVTWLKQAEPGYVISEWLGGKIHVRLDNMKFSMAFEPSQLEHEAVYNSPLYKALL